MQLKPYKRISKTGANGMSLTHEEIWFWYCQYLKWRQTSEIPTVWARNNNLDVDTFRMLKCRFRFREDSSLSTHNRYRELAKAWQTSTCTRVEFCLKNECSEAILSEAVMHLRYMAIVEETRATGVSLDPKRPPGCEYKEPRPLNVKRNKAKQESKKDEELTFKSISKLEPQEIAFPAPATSVTLPDTHPALKHIGTIMDPVEEPKHEDKSPIELTISGIKITIPHETNSTKILKIIDLLKDL